MRLAAPFSAPQKKMSTTSWKMLRQRVAELYRGASESVIDRLVSVARTYSPKYVVRITGDNVFTATELYRCTG